MKNSWLVLLFLVLSSAVLTRVGFPGENLQGADRKKPRPPVSWSTCGRQKAAWYKTPEAMRIADNVLFYQAGIWGWYKNDGSIHPSGNAAIELLSDAEKRQFKESLLQRKYPCTLDNDATHSEMRYLAKVYAATGRKKYKDGFLKGASCHEDLPPVAGFCLPDRSGQGEGQF